MAETWKDRFHEFLAEFLREEHEIEDVVRVTSYYEESYNTGGCETCSYDVHEVHIYYVDSEDVRHEVQISARMEELFGY